MLHVLDFVVSLAASISYRNGDMIDAKMGGSSSHLYGRGNAMLAEQFVKGQDKQNTNGDPLEHWIKL
tara:strand:- start:2352 stop:2552 length:201 start_codon:yes stop_codon:yes gene_type:complete